MIRQAVRSRASAALTTVIASKLDDLQSIGSADNDVTDVAHPNLTRRRTDDQQEDDGRMGLNFNLDPQAEASASSEPWAKKAQGTT